jgi:transcriptional regulator with XRE-family HTH domain
VRNGLLIDKQIGQRIKTLRKHLGLSQIELAERIGISFQQVQKYEKGSTRISVKRIQQLSEALHVDMKDLIGDVAISVSDIQPVYGSGKVRFEGIYPLNKEEKSLLKLFRKIKNKKIREGILKQLRGIVEVERKK